MRYTDMTWERTDSSERTKQTQVRSRGKLVGLRSKTSAHCSLLICNKGGGKDDITVCIRKVKMC
jgi:hypothetical protein